MARREEEAEVEELKRLGKCRRGMSEQEVRVPV